MPEASDASALPENQAITVHGGMHEVLVGKTDEGSVEVTVYNTHTGDRFACTVPEAAVQSKADADESPFIGQLPAPLHNPEQLVSLLRDALSTEAGLAVSIPYACSCAMSAMHRILHAHTL